VFNSIVILKHHAVESQYWWNLRWV